MPRLILASSVLAVAGLGFGPVLASAATASFDPSKSEPSYQETAAPPNTVNCFDYFHFGSIETNITPSSLTPASGTSLTFSGTVTNKNPYPVVDGTLVIKIFRLDSDATQKDVNGPNVVAEFTAKDNIALAAGASIPVQFKWAIPAYAPSGQYEAVTYFTASHKFNLLGLSFTNDVTGPAARFTVSGDSNGLVYFDKNNVSVGGQPYHFAAFIPTEPQTQPVVISAVVRNNTNTEVTVPVTWRVYQWDGQQLGNLVDTETEKVDVLAHETAPVTLTVSDATYPVYFIKGDLTWNDTESILEPRFARAGVQRTRINFPSIMSYPLKAGQSNTLFSCLHNAGEADSVPNGRLDLTLSDMDGNVIKQYTYQGNVTSDMMGVAQAFTPDRDYDSFVIDARLTSGGKEVDTAHIVYDCKDLDPSSCAQAAPMSSLLQMPIDGTRMAEYAGASVLFIMFLTVAVLINRSLKKQDDQLPSA